MDKTVKIMLNEVKYDVKFDTWLKEKIVNSEAKNVNRNHKPVDYAYKNDKAEDWLVRQITNAIDTIYGELNWCTLDESMLQTDEILVNPTEWTITFVFDNNWRGSMRSLRGRIHKYISNHVLYEWYRIARPDAAVSYLNDAERELKLMYEEARNTVVQLEPWRL